MSDFSFETLAARFVGIVARSVPEKLVSPVFSSPLSARSPDISMLWHTGYRKKHKTKLFFKLLLSAYTGCIKGFIKLTTNIKPFGYVLYGKINNAILVIPSAFGSENSIGEYKTAYVQTENDNGIFVFGPVSNCGKNARTVVKLPLNIKFNYFYTLLKSGTYAFWKVEGNLFERFLLFLEWQSWVLGFHWLYYYYLEMALSEVVEDNEITKIGCIHEMHAYARIVWRVASRHKVACYTVQHAAISSGKRWYFSYPEEKESGLILPDIMHVYSRDVIEDLKPYYENVHFILGCSYRYASWKNVNKKRNADGKYYLFVGALARFDNETLITSLRNFLDINAASVPIRLRLHPSAQLPLGGRYWLDASVKKGIIEMSNGASLKSDLESAIAVVGMSTTVLEEALLLGCPVIQLTHPDYLQFINIDGVKGVIKKDYKELCEKDFSDLSNMQIDSESMRKRLGLNEPIVTYKRLFADE